jgi:hypothetical protein
MIIVTFFFIILCTVSMSNHRHTETSAAIRFGIEMAAEYGYVSGYIDASTGRHTMASTPTGWIWRAGCTPWEDPNKMPKYKPGMTEAEINIAGNNFLLTSRQKGAR